MSYRRALILGVFMLLALSALYISAMVPEGEAVERTGLRSDTAPYGGRGPHVIGTRNLAIDGETLLEMTVWYPALKRGDDEEATTYPYEIKVVPPLGASAIATYKGQAIGNAPYNLSTGPYPLVIVMRYCLTWPTWPNWPAWTPFQRASGRHGMIPVWTPLCQWPAMRIFSIKPA